jgi:uncharacterized protein (TIGR02284 family)
MQRIALDESAASIAWQRHQVFAISLVRWWRRRIATQLPDFAHALHFGSTTTVVSKGNIMPTASNLLKETEEAINIVIKSLIDGQEGFQQIGDEIKDDTLKRFFLAESLKRAQFRGELETVLHQEGVHDIKESGSLTGAIHRGWGQLKAKLGGGDHTVLETAEQGEDAAKAAYKDALDRELPLPIRQILTTQQAHIEKSHNYVKAARDSSK